MRRYLYIVWVILFLAACKVLIPGCAMIKGGKTYKTDNVAYSGSLDGNYTGSPQLVKMFLEVKSCMNVAQPVAYPNVKIYQCPELKNKDYCWVPCRHADNGYSDACYERDKSSISIPQKKVQFKPLKEAFVYYISDQIGSFNQQYLITCVD